MLTWKRTAIHIFTDPSPFCSLASFPFLIKHFLQSYWVAFHQTFHQNSINVVICTKVEEEKKQYLQMGFWMYKLALKRKRYVRRFCFLFLGTVFKVVIYTPINLISQDLLNLPRCLLQGILLKFANEKKTLLK